jgi:hypothetical protein
MVLQAARKLLSRHSLLSAPRRKLKVTRLNLPARVSPDPPEPIEGKVPRAGSRFVH